MVWIVHFSVEGQSVPIGACFTNEADALQQKERILAEEAERNAKHDQGYRDVEFILPSDAAAPASLETIQEGRSKKRSRSEKRKHQEKGQTVSSAQLLELHEKGLLLGDINKTKCSIPRVSSGLYSLQTALIIARCDVQNRAATAAELLQMYKADPKQFQDEECLGVTIRKATLNVFVTSDQVHSAF